MLAVAAQGAMKLVEILFAVAMARDGYKMATSPQAVETYKKGVALLKGLWGTAEGKKQIAGALRQMPNGMAKATAATALKEEGIVGVGTTAAIRANKPRLRWNPQTGKVEAKFSGSKETFERGPRAAGTPGDNFGPMRGIDDTPGPSGTGGAGGNPPTETGAGGGAETPPGSGGWKEKLGGWKGYGAAAAGGGILGYAMGGGGDEQAQLQAMQQMMGEGGEGGDNRGTMRDIQNAMMMMKIAEMISKANTANQEALPSAGLGMGWM